MIRGRKTIIIILLAVILVFVGIFVLNIDKDANSTEPIDVYFLNGEMTSIVPEKREVKYENKEELVELVLLELSKGPSESGNVRIMPKDTLWSVSGSSSHLTVDFTQNFLTTDNSRNLLATYAVVKSLCSINGVVAVKVTVSGGELIAPDGNTIDYLSDKDINLEKDKSTDDIKGIKLYFANADNTLSSQWRTVNISESVSLCQNVLTELIKGPDEGTLLPTVSADTEVISMEITEGTAYLNMSKSFIDKNSSTPEKEQLAVYSIVNSLTELDGVENVQFLIDGMKASGFKSIDLTMLFTKNDTIVR